MHDTVGYVTGYREGEDPGGPYLGVACFVILDISQRQQPAHRFLISFDSHLYPLAGHLPSKFWTCNPMFLHVPTHARTYIRSSVLLSISTLRLPFLSLHCPWHNG